MGGWPTCALPVGILPILSRSIHTENHATTSLFFSFFSAIESVTFSNFHVTIIIMHAAFLAVGTSVCLD